MLRASEKEYNILKGEISELRTCITKYTGYIISILGASILINKIIFEKEHFSSLNILILLTLTMLIITLLFEIIWYKFISHNRYVGYFQLLSQEVSHHKLNKGDDFINSKAYLDKYQKSSRSIVDTKNNNLFTWEHLVSRMINAEFQQRTKEELFKATDRVRFVFKIPRSYKYKYLDEVLNVDYKCIDKDFFNQIIYKLYGTKEKLQFSGRISNLLSSLLQFPRSLKYLYTATRAETYSFKNKLSIDIKYVSNGWKYPKKITQIAFISLSLLIIMFVFTLWNDFEFSLKDIQVIDFYPILLTILVIFFFLFWNNRYLNGLTNIINGIGSIDYYCWAFFIFRTQILNDKGIIPVYFSRSFIRFFKSKIILYDLKSREHDFLASKEDCFSCRFSEEKSKSNAKVFCNSCMDEYIQLIEKSKKLDNEDSIKMISFQKIFKSRITLQDLKLRRNEFVVSSKEYCLSCRFTEAGLKKNEENIKVFCESCMNEYTKQIKESKKLEKKFEKVHIIVKNSVKKRLDDFYKTKKNRDK